MKYDRVRPGETAFHYLASILWQAYHSSALTCQGLLLDSLEDSKQSLIKNDVVLSEGLNDHLNRIEHSYSYSIASDGDSIPSSPLSLDLQDDMEQECFPCIPMKKANQQDSFIKNDDTNIFIKRETLSPPLSVFSSTPQIITTRVGLGGHGVAGAITTLPQISTGQMGLRVASSGCLSPVTSCTKPTLVRKLIKQEPDIHVQVKMEPGMMLNNSAKQNPHSLLKPSQTTARLICPKVSVKLEDNSSELSQLNFSTAPLPVINPLTLCSGGRPTITTTHTTNNFTSNNNLQFTSAGTRSNTITSTGSLQNSSSAARQQVHTAAAAMSQARQRILPAVRQTINSPLISTQLKGSSGIICLTEEEKRTLISEGYPIPTKLPLTKSEERSLKKIRRKIKNKISAQESRRKKKEYMDSLERKYDIMQNEANMWRSKAEELEAKNAELAQQIAALQDKLQERSSSICHQSINNNVEENCAYMVPVHAVQVTAADLEDKCSGGQFSHLSSNCLDLD